MELPEIIHHPEIKLIGKRLTTSFSNDRTGDLWRSFMPERKNIPEPSGTELYSVSIFPGVLDTDSFNPDLTFEKWAAMKVDRFARIPPGMDPLIIREGAYAWFVHQGPTHTFPESLKFFYGTWLPGTGYELDHRPHFEVMGKDYLGLDHPDSREHIFIPVKPKNS